MTTLRSAVEQVLAAQTASGKPRAAILAGHNGSGKSTMWYSLLAPIFRMPLINADRMMLSILPEVSAGDHLPSWASELRDNDQSWMQVAQKGVESFVTQAMVRRVPFAMETVFSHWVEHPDGRTESKVDLITQLQDAGYFVTLLFVGLADRQLSIGRVSTRVNRGGHNVDVQKLIDRFPRTQKAIAHALDIADASILTDNSRSYDDAFTVCCLQISGQKILDIRDGATPVPSAILNWLNIVSPRA